MNLNWRIPYGLVTVFIGAFLLYAAWADPPLQGTFLCEQIGGLQTVHFRPDWTLEYSPGCGYADYTYSFFIGFTAIGTLLIGGGIATIREVVG